MHAIYEHLTGIIYDALLKKSADFNFYVLHTRLRNNPITIHTQ